MDTTFHQSFKMNWPMLYKFFIRLASNELFFSSGAKSFRHAKNLSILGESTTEPHQNTRLVDLEN